MSGQCGLKATRFVVDEDFRVQNVSIFDFSQQVWHEKFKVESSIHNYNPANIETKQFHFFNLYLFIISTYELSQYNYNCLSFRNQNNYREELTNYKHFSMGGRGGYLKSLSLWATTVSTIRSIKLSKQGVRENFRVSLGSFRLSCLQNH